MVDLEKALKFKKDGGLVDFLEIEKIFSDHKKGFVASEEDMKTSFGTTNAIEIAEKIVKSGEILLTQEHRDEEKEKGIKQVVEFLSRNAVDPQTGNPHTAERIKNALDQAQVHVKKAPLESQISEIIEKMSPILPIKLETKRVKIVIPSIHIGKVYGVINPYKEDEKWADNGDLEVVVNVPAGLIMDFYDKLNSVTHGSAITEEIKTEE
jgi:ribosome maturation protein SDO1